MDWSNIITELGGGLSAAVICGLAFWAWTQNKRINQLTDKFIEQNAENIGTMKDLTSAIERRATDV